MHGHAPRLADCCYLGLRRYFVTIATARRRPVFASPSAAGDALVHLRSVAATEQFAILAYCFMPDHLHLLVEGEAERANLRTFVAAFKQAAGFDAARRGAGRLWQRGYYDHVLRDDESTFRVARYIVENPVRAGLCRRPEDFPYVGSDRYSLQTLMEDISML